jgi:hypothetical protein
MENDSTLYVGLDVHKDSITVAYAIGMSDVELFGKVGTMHIDIDRLCKKLQTKARHICFVYEAGPCGYGLYRRIVDKGSDGRIELRADGRVVPCREYDKLTEVDQGAVVEHKRLGHALRVSQVVQAQRDNSRIGKAPSRTHRGDSTRPERKQSHAGKKKQRDFTQADIEQVIIDLARPKQPSQETTEAGHRSASEGATAANALPVRDPIFNPA